MNMNMIIVILLWTILPTMLWLIIPKNRVREAIAAFMFLQMLSWLFSIGLTAAGYLESPFRIFMYATKISFTMEYLVYPTLCVLFHLTFPKKDTYLRRSGHYLLWIGIILSVMYVIGNFTELLTFSWEVLIRGFFNFLIVLWLVRQYIVWLTNGTGFSKVDAHAK